MAGQRWSSVWLAVAAFTLVADPVKAQYQTATLQPFKVVQACLPFNLLIAPSPSNTYDVLVNADQAVEGAIRAGVDPTGVLSLVAAGNFSTNNSIQVTVRLPATELEGVTTSSSVGADVVVQGPFTPAAPFNVTNNGASSLVIMNLTAASVNVNNPGAGQFLLEGDIGSVSLSNTGTGTAYVLGVSQSANLAIGGVGNVFIQAASPEVAIAGQASAASLAVVTYDQGTCQVKSSVAAIYGSPCRQATVTPPHQIVYWTCGLALNGSFGCQGNSGSIVSTGGTAGGANTAVSSTGSGTQASSSVSSSTGGSGFSQTTTSSGNGVTTTTQSSNNGQTVTYINGQQVNAAAPVTQCSAAAAQAVLARV